MTPYENRSGGSGVVSYRLGDDSISIQFLGSDRVYAYTHDSAGEQHVERMKDLAVAGEGLCTYVRRHCIGSFVRDE